jgi:hypothetical protein
MGSVDWEASSSCWLSSWDGPLSDEVRLGDAP